MSDNRPPRELPLPPPESLRTLPLEEGARLRDELHSALRDSRRPAIVVLSGNEVGLRKRVQGNAAIGRDPQGEVVLTDAGVSWRHCRLEDRGDAWALIDLGSTNGTVVNGRRQTESILGQGDRIVLGRTVLRFELQDPFDQAYDEHMQRLLNVDDLSGLFVRRRFDQELSRMLDAARSSNTSLGLLVMDMDGIKAINDKHGHLFGAYTIGETGRLIGQVLTRAHDGRGIGSRFGGDEFCAALPGANVDQAMKVAAEIHAAVNAHVYEREGVRLSPGISIGAAVFPADADGTESLFQRADEAMYRAKQGGRNRIAR